MVLSFFGRRRPGDPTTPATASGQQPPAASMTPGRSRRRRRPRSESERQAATEAAAASSPSEGATAPAQRSRRRRRSPKPEAAPSEQAEAARKEEPTGRVRRRRAPAARKASAEERLAEEKAPSAARGRESGTTAEEAAEVDIDAAVRAAVMRATAQSKTVESLLTRQGAVMEAYASEQLKIMQAVLRSLTALEARTVAFGPTSGGQVATGAPRLGVFVDVPNIMYAAERRGVRIDFGRLLEYLSRGRELVRASAYAPISDDPMERLSEQRFVQPFAGGGYRIVTKPLKRFADGSIKANFDVELAIDVLTMSDRLDVVGLVSGDGDFQRLVEMVASKGVKVEVVAFPESTAAELRAVADDYIDLAAHITDFQVV